MSTTLTIAKREFRSYFDSPLAYVVVCLSLLLLGFIVFFGVPRYLPPFWQADQASVRSVVEALPWGIGLLVVPVVTMRLLAEEKRSGTLEMLITLPVKDSSVVFGKYLGACALVASLLVTTLLYPILMFQVWHLGALDWGPVFTAYLGLALFTAATVGIGLLVSSLTESQVIAFFVTFVTMFALLSVDFFGEHVAGPVGDVLHELSLLGHLSSFQRGLLDTGDVLYFVSIAVITLMLSFRSLESRKWA